MTNQSVRASFKFSLRYFVDNDIWLAVKNLKDENPKSFKNSFSS